MNAEIRIAAQQNMSRASLGWLLETALLSPRAVLGVAKFSKMGIHDNMNWAQLTHNDPIFGMRMLWRTSGAHGEDLRFQDGDELGEHIRKEGYACRTEIRFLPNRRVGALDLRDVELANWIIYNLVTRNVPELSTNDLMSYKSNLDTVDRWKDMSLLAQTRRFADGAFRTGLEQAALAQWRKNGLET